MKKAFFKKITVLIPLIFIISSMPLFCQEEEQPDRKSFLSKVSFVMDFSPALYLNTESTKVSAPSPIVYPVSLGALFFKDSRIAFQPQLSFFMMYHLWYDGMALPSEIENRTSQTFSFLLNLPAVWQIFSGEKSRFQLFAGPAILMRFGILANGVKESDSGYSGSASSDMDKINSWFWQNARFLYFSLGGSWLYTFTDHLKAGPAMNLYLPVGSFISGEGAQALIFSLGLKLCI